MIFDFSKLRFDSFGRIEMPDIILCTPSKVQLGALGVYSKAPRFGISLNNISEVEFEIPSHTDNDNNTQLSTPHYDDVLGRMLLRIDPFGYFRIENPRLSNDGLIEKKTVKALSLECELNDEHITGWVGTFPLYDLTGQTESILTMVTRLRPNWSIGYIDPDVMNHWRTFDVAQQTLYGFLKDMERLYQVAFIYDTYERTINCYSINNLARSSMLSLSHDNLIKNTSVDFLDNDIITRLTVLGGGDLTIREYNPRGDAQLYNLDYFMSNPERWFPDEREDGGLVQRWATYKDVWNNTLPVYDNLMVLERTYLSKVINGTSTLSILESRLNGLRARQSEYVAFENNPAMREIFERLQRDIAIVEPQVIAQREYLEQAHAEHADIIEQIREINEILGFSNFFTPEQLNTLEAYFFSDSLTVDAFADSTISFAAPPIAALTFSMGNLVVSGGTINRAVNPITRASTFGIANSNVRFDYRAQIINQESGLLEDVECLTDINVATSTIAVLTSGELICSFEVTTGTITIGEDAFPIANGIVTIAAQGSPSSFEEDEYLHVDFATGSTYATQASTPLGRSRIVRELYEYANAILDDISVPSYQFDIDSVNFFFLEEFAPVIFNFSLGNTVTVAINENTMLEPMLLDVEFDFNDERTLNLKFSNKLNYGSSEFNFVDLLKEAVQRGRDNTQHRFDFRAFTQSGANNVLENFITSALDASRNTIVSSRSQDVSMGGFGILLRQSLDNGEFDDRQMWLVKNQIALTRDSWNSVAMTIGEIQLPTSTNSGSQSMYGVNAELLLGRKIMGNTMELTAKNSYGNNVSNFTFNGNGAYLNNARFTSTNSGGFQIVMDAINQIFAMGVNIYSVDENGIYTPIFNPPADISLETEWWNDNRLNGISLFADSKGDMFLRGNIYSDNAFIRGTIYATDGEFTGDLFANHLYVRRGSGSWQSVFNNDGDMIQGGAVDLNGVTLRNGGVNTMAINNGIVVLGNGANSITVNSNGIVFGNGVDIPIDWGIITNRPSYLTASGITSTTITNPIISSARLDNDTRIDDINLLNFILLTLTRLSELEDAVSDLEDVVSGLEDAISELG